MLLFGHSYVPLEREKVASTLGGAVAQACHSPGRVAGRERANPGNPNRLPGLIVGGEGRGYRSISLHWTGVAPRKGPGMFWTQQVSIEKVALPRTRMFSAITVPLIWGVPV